MNYRKERLNNLVLEELAKIVVKEIEFNDVLVTLTSAEFSDNLKSLKIKFSAIPSSKSNLALEILQKNQGRLRQILLKKIRNHSIPYLNFVIDEGLEKAAEIEKIALDIEKSEKDK